MTLAEGYLERTYFAFVRPRKCTKQSSTKLENVHIEITNIVTGARRVTILVTNIYIEKVIG